MNIKYVSLKYTFIKIAPPFNNAILGVKQCFAVVYHELTTLRRVYFARAALDKYIVESLSTTKFISDYQIRQNEAWVITN